MDKNNNFDEIDNMLFSYFDNNKDIPLSTQDTIINAFNRPSKPISLVYKIQKVAIILICFVILTTGVVFAKDIIKFITSLFSNTTEGIDKAVENGYVQNVDMDFIYDNGIGIKVDYLIMDDSNLDISFVYDVGDYSDVDAVALNEYIIRDENGNVIYYNFEDYKTNFNGESLATYCYNINRLPKTFDNYLHESILFAGNNFPKCKNLVFEIISIKKQNNKIDGNWIFNINLSSKILERNNNYYTASYNKFINNISTLLTETSLKINIELNTSIDNNILLSPNNIRLKNNLTQEYSCIEIKSGNIQNPDSNTISLINLEFDMSKYSENITDLNLYIKLDNNKIIDISLKEQ